MHFDTPAAPPFRLFHEFTDTAGTDIVNGCAFNNLGRVAVGNTVPGEDKGTVFKIISKDYSKEILGIAVLSDGDFVLPDDTSTLYRRMSPGLLKFGESSSRYSQSDGSIPDNTLHQGFQTNPFLGSMS